MLFCFNNMKTILTNNPKQAAKFILKSDVVAFPTETVYGLGADVFDEKAVRKIFSLKKRPHDNPLIVHIADKKQVNLIAESVNETAKKLINKYFPGPLTIILKKHEVVPDVVTTGLGTVAVRMPSSKIARDFIRACGVPVAAPSANLSGSPSPTGFAHVLEDFNGKVSCILIGPQSKYGLESTVIDCSGNTPRVLRPGIITVEELRKIDSRIKLVRKSSITKSPGTKYRHYSPKAKVIIVKAPAPGKLNESSAYIGVKSLLPLNRYKLGMYKHCKSKLDYAKSLFSFFRECDTVGIKTILAEKVDEKGIGLAIMNRLKKASFPNSK
jgi:L-threonylcarbamoyladenylate synthase